MITITAVMPSAMMPSTVSWSSTFSRLRRLRKELVLSAKAMHSTSRLISGPCATRRSPQDGRWRGASAAFGVVRAVFEGEVGTAAMGLS